MIDWTEILAPIRTGFNEMAVTYFRDPSLILAVLLALPGLLLGILNAFSPGKRLLTWSLGRLSGLSAFFGILGFTLCVIPVNRGWLFTRTQALVAAGLVVVSWAFVIFLHKWTEPR